MTAFMVLVIFMLVACDRGGSDSGYGFEVDTRQAYNGKIQAGFDSLNTEDQAYVKRYARRVKVVNGPISVDENYGAGPTSHGGIDVESKTIYIQSEWIAKAKAEEVGRLLGHEAGHVEFYIARHKEGLKLTPAQEHRQMEARGL